MIDRELLDLVEARRAIDLALDKIADLTPNGARPLALAPNDMQSWDDDRVLLQVATAIAYIAEGLLESQRGDSLYSLKSRISTWGRDTGRAPYLLEGPVAVAMLYFGIGVVFDSEGFAYSG